LLRRRTALPSPVRGSLRAACRAASLDPHVLAEAPGPGPADQRRWAVALRSHLGYGSGDDWTFVPWHEVDHGSWNGETATLEVDQRGEVTDGLVRPGGRRHRIELTDPQRVPEVMADRVAATILFHRQLPVPDSAAVLTVTARRNLADQSLEWLAVPGRGVRTRDPEVRQFAAAAIRRLRREYE